MPIFGKGALETHKDLIRCPRLCSQEAAEPATDLNDHLNLFFWCDLHSCNCLHLMSCELPYSLSSKMPTVLRKCNNIFLGGKRERRKEGKKKWIGREEEKRDWLASFLWYQLENIFLFKSIKINMPTTTKNTCSTFLFILGSSWVE